MTKIELTPAYLIHRRAYQDNSLLLDFLTLEHGRIRLVARGSRQSKTKLQMFMQLRISYAGRGELKSLSAWEVDDTPRVLSGERLILGVYINELVERLLHEGEAHEQLFAAYQSFIGQLPGLPSVEQHWQLRLFENQLLESLGYGLDFAYDDQGEFVHGEKRYHYHEQLGFQSSASGIIPGELLLQLAQQGDVPDAEQLKICRNLNRQRLQPLLGDKPLHSRELYFK